jgi:methylenetetrahydrofolate reductase (NADPH)
VARIADLLASGRTYSFEFFPPKTDGAQLTLGRTISELESLHPSFVSVTYGAGGTTRQRTNEVVTWVRKETDIEPMAHLTCFGHTHGEIAEILDSYASVGVENIMALRGDPPMDPTDARPSDFHYAVDLVHHIADHGGFSIGVGAHPEVHPQSRSRQQDRLALAHKLEAADFAVTQLFFEVDHYVALVEELAALNCHKPIVPGIMPVTNLRQMQRMAQLSGAAFPAWLAVRLEAAETPDEVRRVGVAAATELCAALLDAGAPGLHFYTMNRSSATREIYADLGLPART